MKTLRKLNYAAVCAIAGTDVARSLCGARVPGNLDLVNPDDTPAVWLEVLEETPQFNFGRALELLKEGKCVARAGWNGKGMRVSFVEPISDTALPYLALSYPAGSATYPYGAMVPWAPSQTDVLAEDWEEVM
jgi:hypothetical protein